MADFVNWGVGLSSRVRFPIPSFPLYLSQRGHCGEGWIIETICVNSERITIRCFNFKAFRAEVTFREVLQISACWEIESLASSWHQSPEMFLPQWKVHSSLPFLLSLSREAAGTKESSFSPVSKIATSETWIKSFPHPCKLKILARKPRLEPTTSWHKVPREAFFLCKQTPLSPRFSARLWQREFLCDQVDYIFKKWFFYV